MSEEEVRASIPSPSIYGSFQEGLDDNSPLTKRDFGAVILRYQIDLIARLHPCIPGIRESKAYELGMLYGKQGLAQSILSSKYISQQTLREGIKIDELLVYGGIYSSKTEARKAIEANAPRLNGMPIVDKFIVNAEFLEEEGYIHLSSSKKHRYGTKECIIIERTTDDEYLDN